MGTKSRDKAGLPPSPLMSLFWIQVQDPPSLATRSCRQPHWGKVLIVIACGSLSHLCHRAIDSPRVSISRQIQAGYSTCLLLLGPHIERPCAGATLAMLCLLTDPLDWLPGQVCISTLPEFGDLMLIQG